jgi:pimeloyl-ACP methyl ester carboxylesterase
MKERIVRIAGGRLVGVLAEPNDKADSNRPVVLIPNTGVDHRVGPNRLHVHLCRALANAGFPALRIDLSGMGDSAPPSAGQINSTKDLQGAMDELQKQGFGSRFVVAGLCSGANDAHLLTRLDNRVIAMASIDGYAYPTLRYHLTYWWQRLGDPTRVLRNWRSHFTPEDDEDDKAGFAAEQVEFFKQPSLQEMQRDLAALMRRRVRLFFVYTGQVQHEYNYATQLTDAFPSLRKYELLRLEYMAHADHTFSRAPMRAALIEMLLSWLDSVNKSSSTYASTESSDDELVRDSGFRQMRA